MAQGTPPSVIAPQTPDPGTGPTTSVSHPSRLLRLAALGLILTIGLLWLSTIPLGIPGEWTWPRLPADAQTSLNLLMAGIGAAVYFIVVMVGRQKLSHLPSRRQQGIWLALLVIVGAGWLWIVQETSPVAGQFAKGPFVLYYPSSSGYFYKARYENPDAGPFLANYEALMEQGDVLHVGTHPPGLFLFFHGLIALQHTAPGLMTVPLTLAPASFREAFAIVQENSGRTNQPATPADLPVLWAAFLLVLLMAALTVVPLYGLLRFSLPPQAAWSLAALWPTFPALAIFIPKSDAAFPFLSTCLVWTVVQSWRRFSVGLAIVAGGIACLALTASLAFLPPLLFCGVYIVLERWWVPAHPVSPRRAGAWLLGGTFGFATPIVLFWLVAQMNLLNVWRWNYFNHANFYTEYPRTGWAWFLLNPFELTLAVGAPLMVAVIYSLIQQSRLPLRPTSSRLATGTALGIGALLWISGKNSGEAARLWLLMMPALLWMAAQGRGSVSNDSDSPSILQGQTFPVLLILQLAACVATVHRVGGFHLSSTGS